MWQTRGLPAQFSLLAPFNLTGFLLACTTSTFASGCAPANLVFQSPIEGGGIASINLTSFAFPPADRLFDRGMVTYTFFPTPEPSTLLLVTGGGLAVRVPRRRPKSRSAPREPPTGPERIRTVGLG